MCNCGKGKALKYEVTKGDGTKVVVTSLADAQMLVRRVGGVYRAVAA